MSDRDTIKAILTRYEDAIRRRDAEAIVADYAADAIGYDLAPPLLHNSATLLDADGIRDWFDTWEDDLRVTHTGVHIFHDGDLAVLHCLQLMTGTKKGEAPSSLWFRATIMLRRIEDAWKIGHIHTSVPMAMDGSEKALTGLTPQD
ncbi:nuclear transport factor 2 family protein [Sphingomonas sp. AOB5]|uniref:YybH family protein n=1 Tax=Sphingomonas sp. AOB5 TaxID=3034017 RepID=UPI0023F9BBFA|nr:nuclear transport factor 2 family protein [Sphingomonas sp. AOB5]MDF7774984.1 nuclear transport factor 2 family protein [Sphingomonas sp. AOB5]